MAGNLSFPPSNDKDFYFLSYNHEDTERISPIAQKLHQNGMHIWYDNGLAPGNMIETVLAEKIRDSKTMIMFFTNRTLLKEHPFVQQEYEVAKNIYNKTIIVVLLDSLVSENIPADKAFWINSLRKAHLIDESNQSDSDKIADDIKNEIDDLESRILTSSAGFPGNLQVYSDQPKNNTEKSTKISIRHIVYAVGAAVITLLLACDILIRLNLLP